MKKLLAYALSALILVGLASATFGVAVFFMMHWGGKSVSFEDAVVPATVFAVVVFVLAAAIAVVDWRRKGRRELLDDLGKEN